MSALAPAVLAPGERSLIELVGRGTLLVCPNARGLPYAATILDAFLRWAWVEQQQALDIARLLQPAVIDYFLLERAGDLTTDQQARCRHVLHEVSKDLDRSSGPAFALAASRLALPYDSFEQALLLHWARGQSTVERRDDAHVLLALGLGAGLHPREILHCRGADVEISDDAVHIHVRTNPFRRVQVSRRRETILRQRVLEISPEQLLFRPRRAGGGEKAISTFVARSRSTIRPHVQRMRATWLLEQIRCGTPLAVLVQAAGMPTLRTLDRLRKQWAHDQLSDDGTPVDANFSAASSETMGRDKSPLSYRQDQPAARGESSSDRARKDRP